MSHSILSIAQKTTQRDIYAFFLGCLIVFSDMVTKQLVLAHFASLQMSPIEVFGVYFQITATTNNGAAFSSFTNSSFLLFVILIVLGGLFVWYYKAMQMRQEYLKLPIAAIIGGASSNVLDRLLHNGYVTDFLSFNIPQIHFYFAIFNLADAFISIAIIVLGFLLLFSRKTESVPLTSSDIAEKVFFIPFQKKQVQDVSNSALLSEKSGDTDAI